MMVSYDVVERLDELFRLSAISDGAQVTKVPAAVLPRCYGLGPEDLPLDWRIEWEERAAIMEFCGGLPREQAEAMALQETLDRMTAAGKKEEST